VRACSAASRSFSPTVALAVACSASTLSTTAWNDGA
jgi:hypothetical protein